MFYFKFRWWILTDNIIKLQFYEIKIIYKYLSSYLLCDYILNLSFIHMFFFLWVNKMIYYSSIVTLNWRTELVWNDFYNVLFFENIELFINSNIIIILVIRKSQSYHKYNNTTKQYAKIILPFVWYFWFTKTLSKFVVLAFSNTVYKLTKIIVVKKI